MRLTCTSAVAKDLRSVSLKSRWEEPAEAGGEAVWASVTGAHAVRKESAAAARNRFMCCCLLQETSMDGTTMRRPVIGGPAPGRSSSPLRKLHGFDGPFGRAAAGLSPTLR